MAFCIVGQPGQPQGLTWPSTLWVAQPDALCAADEGVAVTPQHPTALQPSPSTQGDSLLPWRRVSKGRACKVSIYNPFGHLQLFSAGQA